MVGASVSCPEGSGTFNAGPQKSTAGVRTAEIDGQGSDRPPGSVPPPGSSGPSAVEIVRRPATR